MNKRELFIYFFCVVFFLVVGGLEGYLTNSDMSWYQSIHKTSWNPPNFIFGPVWTTLYICMGITLGHLWYHPTSKIIWTIFILQTLFNFLWTPLFFIYHHIFLALVDLTCLVVCLWTWLYLTRDSKIRFWLFLPYTLWVSFAWLLNYNIWVLN